jgi:S1-C subfamily serine protease
MWKKIFVLLVVALFTYGCCSVQKPEIVYRYRDVPSPYLSVVGLRVPHINEADGYAIGTGFAVTKKHLVTAGHLCKATKDDLTLRSYFEVLFVNNNGEVSVIADKPKIVKIAKNTDLCLLKLSGHGIVPLPIMKRFRVHAKIGDALMAFGAPFGAFPTQTSGHMIDPDWNGKFIYSAPTAPGNSGGPVINDSGELVGVAVQRDLRYSHLSFAVPAHTVRKFLKENKVKLP